MNLIDQLKDKIDDARRMLTGGNNTVTLTSAERQELEMHINDMSRLLEDIEQRGDGAEEEFRDRVNVAIEKLNNVLDR